MIKSKRFDFLDKETNVAVSAFTSDLDSGILNSVENELTSVSETVESLFDSAVQSGKELFDSFDTEDIFGSVTRVAKDVAGSVIDLASLPTDAVDGFFGDLGGNDSAIGKALKNIMRQCSNRGMGYGIPGRPFDPSINCGAGNISLGRGGYGGYGSSGGSCNASSFGNLLSKLSGGKYGGAFNDYNKALQALMSLGGYGYNLGMCGVFGALSQGLPNNVLSRGAGGLLTLMASAGNTNAVLDIAKSAVGLTPLATNPSGIQLFLKNYQKPSNVRESGLMNLADRTLAGLELLSDQWDKSDYDDIPSLGEAPGFSRDLAETFKAKLSDHAFDDDHLGVPPSSDDVFVQSAYLLRV